MTPTRTFAMSFNLSFRVRQSIQYSRQRSRVHFQALSQIEKIQRRRGDLNSSLPPIIYCNRQYRHLNPPSVLRPRFTIDGFCIFILMRFGSDLETTLGNEVKVVYLSTAVIGGKLVVIALLLLTLRGVSTLN
jgi:hypothetical protein